jgi:hypothetical protein
VYTLNLNGHLFALAVYVDDCVLIGFFKKVFEFKIKISLRYFIVVK